MCTTLLTHEYTPHCMPQLYPMHTHAHNHHPQVQKLTKATAWTLPMWNTCMFMCLLLLFSPLIYIMPTGSKLPHIPRVQYFFWYLTTFHHYIHVYTQTLRIYSNTLSQKIEKKNHRFPDFSHPCAKKNKSTT